MRNKLTVAGHLNEMSLNGLIDPKHTLQDLCINAYEVMNL